MPLSKVFAQRKRSSETRAVEITFIFVFSFFPISRISAQEHNESNYETRINFNYKCMYYCNDNNCTYISMSRYMYIFLCLDHRYVLYIYSAQYLVVCNIDFVPNKFLFII